MKQVLTALAALATAAACTSPAQGHETGRQNAHFAAADVACHIEVRDTRRGAEFEALAFADRPISGDYELVVTKIDADGEADIVQSGEFALGRGQEASLGLAELGLDRRPAGRARLVLWSGGDVICRAEQRI